MDLVIVAVRDEKAGCFPGRPWFAMSEEAAVRSFGDALGAQDSPVASHPEDYSLWLLGSFNPATGGIVPVEGGKRHLVSAVDLMVRRPELVKEA